MRISAILIVYFVGCMANTRAFQYCPLTIGSGFSCTTMPLSQGCYCFTNAWEGGWYQLNKFASEWTNSSLIAFDAQISTTIERFDHFVNLPKGYTFWTQAYYDQSAQLWMWSANYPVDTSLFCNNTVPPAKRKKCAIPNGVFYDGSGCLKSGRRDVKRYPLLVGFDYKFFSGSSSSSSEI